jgi:hypothetical protein
MKGLGTRQDARYHDQAQSYHKEKNGMERCLAVSAWNVGTEKCARQTGSRTHEYGIS